MVKQIKVGITGQPGFMGAHFFNYLGLKENIKRIHFEDQFFENGNQLDKFVQECDVIVHLAAMNRHGDPQVIYDTNIKLVNDLLAACERTNSKPHIIFSSSTQESQDNLYGKSKKDGRQLFENWATLNNSKFTALIIPNVFGPFGNPYYNSVIATFSHQLTHDGNPEVHVDGELKLIYINELVEEFYSAILETLPLENGESIINYEVLHTSVNKVTDILKILERFKSDYFENGNTTFETLLEYGGYDPYGYKNELIFEIAHDAFTEILASLTEAGLKYSSDRNDDAAQITE